MAAFAEPYQKNLRFLFSRRSPRSFATPESKEDFNMTLYVKASIGVNYFQEGTPQHGFFELFRPENRSNGQLKNRIISNFLYKPLAISGLISSGEIKYVCGEEEKKEEGKSRDRRRRRRRRRRRDPQVLKVLFRGNEPEEQMEWLEVNFTAEKSQGNNPSSDVNSTAYLFFECFRPENRENHFLAQKALAFAFLDGFKTKSVVRVPELTEESLGRAYDYLEMGLFERSQEEDAQEGMDFLMQMFSGLNNWENEQSD